MIISMHTVSNASAFIMSIEHRDFIIDVILAVRDVMIEWWKTTCRRLCLFFFVCLFYFYLNCSSLAWILLIIRPSPCSCKRRSSVYSVLWCIQNTMAFIAYAPNATTCLMCGVLTFSHTAHIRKCVSICRSSWSIRQDYIVIKSFFVVVVASLAIEYNCKRILINCSSPYLPLVHTSTHAHAHLS